MGMTIPRLIFDAEAFLHELGVRGQHQRGGVAAFAGSAAFGWWRAP